MSIPFSTEDHFLFFLVWAGLVCFPLWVDSLTFQAYQRFQWVNGANFFTTIIVIIKFVLNLPLRRLRLVK